MEKKNWFEQNPKKTIFFIVFIGLLLSISIAEVFFRYTSNKSDEPDSLRYIRLKEWPPLISQSNHPDDKRMQKADSLIQMKYEIKTDRDGFIQPSQRYEKADKTIVFLGGSTTECFYVGEYNRFPYLSGVLLEQMTGLKINSYNGGVAGNNSLHSLNILLNKVIPLKPDIVAMMHNINDLSILLYEKSYWNNNPYRSPIVIVPNFKNENVRLVDFLKTVKNFLIPNVYQKLVVDLIKVRLFGVKIGIDVDEFERVRGQKVVSDKEKIKKEFEMNLQTFISLCKIRGITPVLMTQQNRLTPIPDPLISKTLVAFLKKNVDIEYKDYKEVYDLLSQTIRTVGLKNGVMVIDLDKEIPHTKEFMYDVVHFNDNGSKLAAEIISKKLLPVVRQ
ncbi:MAG: hypothetical protein HZB80_00475 [Deltaproteobacteria bacterium]|nr:hypothetical protein [Deltaproteobacteria bacterium]